MANNTVEPVDDLSDEDAQQRDAFIGRVFNSALEAIELSTIYLGDRLGLYRALASEGPRTPSELAAAAGTSERYTREWLEQQAVAGLLAVDDSIADEQARRYRLPAGHAAALLDLDSPYSIAPLARVAGGVLTQLRAVRDAFRTGAGIPYANYGEDAREGQADMNRPVYLNLLGNEWLPTIPDLHARLQGDPPARVADVGCGAGWSTIAIARAYPRARVDGFDADPASVALARSNAADAGLADRVSFQVADVASLQLASRYDLVTAFETIHDMARPVEALHSMRRLAADGGAVVIMDERVAESFTAPGNEVERFMYGASILMCLPNGLAETPSAGTGTVMRPATLRRYAQEAGFSDVEVLPIEHDFFRLYRLVP